MDTRLQTSLRTLYIQQTNFQFQGLQHYHTHYLTWFQGWI